MHSEDMQHRDTAKLLMSIGFALRSARKRNIRDIRWHKTNFCQTIIDVVRAVDGFRHSNPEKRRVGQVLAKDFHNRVGHGGGDGNGNPDLSLRLRRLRFAANKKQGKNKKKTTYYAK